MMSSSKITRRTFVDRTARMALGATMLPRRMPGSRGHQAPSDTLNVAIVGAGGMGMSNAESLLSQRIVALCDVDFGYVDRQLLSRLKDRDGATRPVGIQLQEAYLKAKRYGDFREMLAKQGDIDGVVIATPDHSHAVIAKAAMDAGKHVYIQKPLTYSVHEARVLRDTARRTKVVTQMGNQGHSGNDARLINEWIDAGIIGPVREVSVWTNRPIWPQGIGRPAAPAPGTPAPASWNRRTIAEATAAAMAVEQQPPAGLDWELYLGPVPDVPYHSVYHPFNWRGWVDFGVGAIGDMGAHLIDHPFWALGLDLPATIEATSTPWGGSAAAPATYPLAMTAHYQFPARGERPPVRLSWYDGGLMPPRPAVLPDSVVLSREGGVIFMGEKGILVHETYGRNPKLYPEALMEAAAAVPQSLPRIEVSHELNWAMACKGEGQASCPLDYAAPLTEVMLLGMVALRAGQGRKITYDAAQMKIPNAPEAEQYLTRPYRSGWAV